MSSDSRLLVTGASGQLGRLVVDALLQTVPTSQMHVLVRSEKAAAEFAARGVVAHVGDYNTPAALDRALSGVQRVLLISSSENGRRVPQHGNVIAAATRASVALLAYTSILRADTTPLALAGEHLETEKALGASGVPFALLRNGWYTENKTASIPPALAHGAVIGSAGDGRFSTAARADYAAAAAAVLTADTVPADAVYELAGDTAFTLAEFAAEIARAAGRPVVYRNLPEVEYAAALGAAGLPPSLAGLIADSDTGASSGALFDDSKTLSRLIRRPTTPWQTTVKDAVAAAKAAAQ